MALVSIFLNYCSDNSQEAEKIAELYAHYDDNFKTFLSQAQQEMGKEIIKYEIIDTDLLPKKVTITGNHYELGYLIGLIGKKYNHLLIRPTSPNQEINQKIIQMYQNIYPQYLEKARGVAEAYGLTIDDIDFRYLEHDFYTGLWCRLFRYPEFVNLTGFSSSNTNCSVVSYFLETQNRHIIGRNFDNQSERPHFLVITKLDGVYKTIGNACYALHHWICDGINEQGLFIGVATNENPSKYIDYRDDRYPDKPAVQVIHMHRIILETCASVNDALDIIGKMTVWFPVEVNHFLIADATGNSVVVEFDGDKNMVTFPRKHPYHVLTNTALQEGIDFVISQCWRYSTAINLLSSGINGIGELFEVMRKIQFISGDARTLWTGMYDLSKKEMDVRFKEENYGIIHIANFQN